MSVSDNMVMEVVSAAVSGREVAGNWMRIVYTESASPLQSAKNTPISGLSVSHNSLTFYFVQEIICAPALMAPVSVVVAPFPLPAPRLVARPVPGTPAQRVEGARGRQSDGLLARPGLLTSADLQRPEVLTSSEAGLAPAPAPEATSARAEETEAEQATPHLVLSLTWNTDTRSRKAHLKVFSAHLL